jgi:Domain of unknown function (DUF4352)
LSDQQPEQPHQTPSWAQQPPPPPQWGQQPPPPSQWGQRPPPPPQWGGPQWGPPQPPPPNRRRGLKITLGVVGGLVVLGVIAGIASGSGGGGGKKNTTADHTPAATAPTTSSGATKAATPAAKPKDAHVGDTITVHGMDEGSKLAVTLVKWVDPAKGGDEFTTPGAGKRFVAAQIRVTNTGSAFYDDTPSNGMQVADANGQRFESTFGDVSAGPSMPAEVKLAAGDKALGYVTFEVPKGSKIVTLQFTADSGFADEAGEWKIP